MGSIVTIHIPLLDEGTSVWRPVQAENLGGNIYRIIFRNKVPEDEHWTFSTGQIVMCADHTFQDGTKALVAIQLREDAG